MCKKYQSPGIPVYRNTVPFLKIIQPFFRNSPLIFSAAALFPKKIVSKHFSPVKLILWKP